MADTVVLAKRGDAQCLLLPGAANCQGLVTGAAGSGKTITQQTWAKNFSLLGGRRRR